MNLIEHDRFARSIKWAAAQEMVYDTYTYEEFYAELKKRYENLISQVEGGVGNRDYDIMMKCFEGEDIRNEYNKYAKGLYEKFDKRAVSVNGSSRKIK